MKKLYTLCCFLLFAIVVSDAQRDETIFRDGSFKLTGIWGGATNGFVRVGNDFSLNNGGFFSFEINKRFLIGWSGYGSGTTLDDGRHIDINGNDLLLGYGFDTHKSLHPFIYLKTGGGRLQVSEERSDNVFVFEPSAGFETNIFQWFRLGIDGGYRFVSNVDLPDLNDGDVSSPFVNIRFKFGWSWGNRYVNKEFDD